MDEAKDITAVIVTCREDVLASSRCRGPVHARDISSTSGDGSSQIGSRPITCERHDAWQQGGDWSVQPTKWRRNNVLFSGDLNGALLQAGSGDNPSRQHARNDDGFMEDASGRVAAAIFALAPAVGAVQPLVWLPRK